MKEFEVVFMEEAFEFLQEIEGNASKKIIYNIEKSKLLNDVRLLKKLKGKDLWEFRTVYNKTQYRLLAFWDKRGHADVLVIFTHGFIKKTQKTPINELTHAVELRKEYFLKSK